MNEKERTRASKFLSLVLRHEPERIGIELDGQGWVGVETLLSALRAHGKPIDRAQLDEIVATNEKKRYAYSDDGQRIRANQGHSVEVSLGYAAQRPPKILYHGTAERYLSSIQKEGLLKRERHHVHLTSSAETALNVGRRHGAPVILVVDANAMQVAGYEFFLSENGVWLTDHVPPQFLKFERPRPEGAPKRSTRAAMAQETVRICEVGSYTAPDGRKVEIGQTLRRATEGSELCSSDSELASVHSRGEAARIEVTRETTIAASRRLAMAGGGKLACLNFASARNPGGGFLGGSEAQEESLARSSGLYPCLLKVPEYYERNRACESLLYLDLAIWSPGVPFFRNDEGELLNEPFETSVITAPAPNAGAVAMNQPERGREVEPCLRRRTHLVLSVAASKGVQRLVLGAWGCGVFRNDPAIVARVFAEYLCGEGEFARTFQEVTFAIVDRSADEALLKVFRAALLG